MKIKLLLASAIVGISFLSVANTANANVGEQTLFNKLSSIKETFMAENQKFQLESEKKSESLNISSVDAEKKQLEITKNQADLASLERSLEQNKQNLMERLNSRENNSDELFNRIQDQINNYKTISNKIDELKAAEKSSRQLVETQLDEMSSMNRQQDALVLKTKEEVRLVVESELNSPIAVKTNKTVQCSPDESLKSCMLRPSIKKSIINATLHQKLASNSKSDIFNNLDYQIVDFKYLSATQQLDGKTDFSVEASVLIKSNFQMFSKFYQFVGLPETGVYKLTLLSNRNASFYLNGKSVGQGTEVTADVERGYYVVNAKYKGKSESTQENIVESKSLFYSF